MKGVKRAESTLLLEAFKNRLLSKDASQLRSNTNNEITSD
jgi:hypothetical protein